MILGLSVPVFTQLHTIISLIAIAAGLVLLGGFLAGQWLGGINRFFLAFTILTSVTGFFFHSKKFGPPHVVGVISLIILGVALWALYGKARVGGWRAVYAACAVAALYLNVFVLIVQAFQKIPALNAFAPTGSEPPFMAAQAIALIAFLLAGWLAVKRRA